MKIFVHTLLAVILFDILSPAAAYAYIDPGLGSLFLQGLAAGFISLMVFWRGFRDKVKSILKREDDKRDNGHD